MPDPASSAPQPGDAAPTTPSVSAEGLEAAPQPSTLAEEPSADGGVVVPPAAPPDAPFLVTLVVLCLVALASAAPFAAVGLAMRRSWQATQRSGLVPVAVGLALAILAFPGPANEFGSSVRAGTQATLRVMPAAVDWGTRCAWAEPEPGDNDGCLARGALALPLYLGEGLHLVFTEARLGRLGVRFDPTAYDAGLALGQARGRWGLERAPYSAMAEAIDVEARASSQLDTSAFALFFVVAVLGGASWRYLRRILDDASNREQLAPEELAVVTSARLKNLALVGILAMGAYLSFAALTAIGPFMKARQLASQTGALSAESRIEATDATWRAAALTHIADEADDLGQVEEALPRFARLRREVLKRRFAQLAESYGAFITVHDTAFFALEEQRTPEGVDRATAAQIRASASLAQASMKGAWGLVDDVRQIEGGVEPRAAAGWRDRYRKAQLDLDQAQKQILDKLPEPAAADAPDPAGPFRTAIVGSLEGVSGALTQHKLAFEDAVEDYRNAEAIAQSEVKSMVEALAQHRALRWQLRQARSSLDRQFGQVRLSARDQLVQEQAQFSAFQRTSPGWLDRVEALANWYELAFSRANEDLQICADEVDFAEDAERQAIRRALDNLPRQQGADPLPITQLAASLESFRAELPELGAEVPACVEDGVTLPALPDQASFRQRYGTAIGLVSGWLMQSGTLDLVMIAGMLGFGLLGAGLSRIVRNRIREPGEGPSPAPTWMPHRPDQQAMVEDVPAIVFQGLGATLVVYLAGVGGLGAISSSTPTLDPYVLMLSCFVASVFSEDVWRNARDWMRARKLPQ